MTYTTSRRSVAAAKRLRSQARLIRRTLPKNDELGFHAACVAGYIDTLFMSWKKNGIVDGRGKFK